MTRYLSFLLGIFLLASPVLAQDYPETPYLQEKVNTQKVPPIQQRLPQTPLIVEFNDQLDQKPGKVGGTIDILLGREKEVRMLSTYSYARLVGYTPDLALKADILESFEDKDGKEFTLKLRPGHKWSDGHPFTSEDFRFFWEDVATNPDLSTGGVPMELLVDGEAPTVEIVDDHTIRYKWSKPNPFFLPALAKAAPLYIYRPAHYLKKFHAKYAKEELDKLVTETGSRNWADLYDRMDEMGRNTNIDLPTLDAWVNTTPLPAQRFIFVRNPYFHRVDVNHQQLPYIDEIRVMIVDPKLIPAKAGAGETDLQARNINLSDAPLLKQGEKSNNYRVLFWEKGVGSQLAIFPNLNTNDEGWRKILRDVRFRRALSIGIDRHDINKSVYFGLGRESNNTILDKSPLFKPEYQTKWAEYAPDKANKLLDEMGLDKRDGRGIRTMQDGRPIEITVETGGEGTEESDILTPIAEHWKKLGILMHIKPSQREVLRNRVYSGETVMSTWIGLDNAIPTNIMPPEELVPVRQENLAWPKWGQYAETAGKSGEAVDLPEAQKLLDLYQQWMAATTDTDRTRIWQDILGLYVDQVFSIGTISGTAQPIVVNKKLENVPAKGIYSWDPGAHFGIYRPDIFWLNQ